MNSTFSIRINTGWIRRDRSKRTGTHNRHVRVLLSVFFFFTFTFTVNTLVFDDSSGDAQIVLNHRKRAKFNFTTFDVNGTDDESPRIKNTQISKQTYFLTARVFLHEWFPNAGIVFRRKYRNAGLSITLFLRNRSISIWLKLTTIYRRWSRTRGIYHLHWA